MTFKPTIVGEEELELPSSVCSADGELSLPQDLASLAEQLSGEAARLAGRYPPGARLDVRLPVREKAQRGRPAAPDVGARFVGAALVLLMASGLGAAIWSWSGGRRVPPVQTATPLPAPAVHLTGPDATRAQNVGRPAESAPSGTEETAVFVQELSGPELEGFLDLLEQQDAAAARLSI